MILLLFALLMLAAPAWAQSPCAVTVGFSGTWQGSSYVQQFWWDSTTQFMEVFLSDGEVHGFVNIPAALAQQFSQESAAQTQQFYQQIVAPYHEALLYEKSPAYLCPLQLEGGGYLWTR